MWKNIADTELNELVMVHLEGTASEDQRARLEARLASNPRDVQRYIEYVRESAMLETTFGVDSSADPRQRRTVARGRGGITASPVGEAAERRVRRGNGEAPTDGARQIRGGDLWWFIATAVAVLLAAFVGSRWNGDGPNQTVAEQAVPEAGDPTHATAGSDRDVVARVIRKVDCVWEDEKWKVQSSAELAKGQMLRISQGMMEIQFECGARVALEGPARFTVAGAQLGVLHSGDLTAEVPEQARGFSIKAPTTNVVDLGTSFALKVRGDGSTEVHVMDGEVLSQRLDQQGAHNGEEVRLLERDALLVSFDGDQRIEFVDAPQYLRKGTGSTSLAAGWPVDLADHLALWLSAGHDVELDSRGCVRRWGDRLYGGNTRANMAWQIQADKRPLWVDGALAGQPGLRFDGNTSSMITDSLVTGDELTVLVVLSAEPWHWEEGSQRAHFISRQVLNFNGPPNLAMQFVEDNRFCSWNFNGVKSQRLGRVGLLRSEPLPSNEPLLVRYTYSLEKQTAELAINGKSQGTVPVSDSAAIDSPKYIGCHWSGAQHFQGVLGELLVFNEALTDEALATLSHHLATKYKIPVD